MIHTNRCKHCGKTKEEHNFFKCQPGFYDSGLAALDAHKEELYEAIVAYRDNHGLWGDVDNVLNQIEKEK